MSSKDIISKSYKDARVISKEKSCKMWWLTHTEGNKYLYFKYMFIALCSLYPGWHSALAETQLHLQQLGFLLFCCIIGQFGACTHASGTLEYVTPSAQSPRALGGSGWQMCCLWRCQLAHVLDELLAWGRLCQQQMGLLLKSWFLRNRSEHCLFLCKKQRIQSLLR